jgi:hypothetical protein
MAKVKKNVIIEGLSGRIGDLVFRQYGDQTVVSKRPTHDPARIPTPGEAQQQARIKQAAALAKARLAKPEGQAYYQAARQRLNKRSAYHTAIYDFFGVPAIVAVEGTQDGSLHIRVQDNVGVCKVRVQVGDMQGKAQPQEEVPCNWWIYPLNGAGPWVVRVWAEDGMGNVGTWEGEID